MRFEANSCYLLTIDHYLKVRPYLFGILTGIAIDFIESARDYSNDIPNSQ